MSERPPRHRINLAPPLWWWVTMSVLLLLSLTSCRTTENVSSVTDRAEDSHAVKVIDRTAVHDTLIVRDSVVVTLLRDSIREVSRWHEVTRIVTKTDTMYVAKTDTIVKTYVERVSAETQKNKYPVWLLWLLLALIVMLVIRLLR